MLALVRTACGAACAALFLAAASASADEPEVPAARWCAPELEALPGDVCHFQGTPGASGRRTLVVFLHGVIQPDSGWQWNQQRGIVVGAKRLGFSVLMPRGRRGIGPPSMTDWITWPTSVAAQRSVEDDVVAEWMKAKALLETRAGRAYDEVFVIGFSNGAYYASSLALRGRLEVQGYAVFAGGGAKYLRRDAGKTTRRAPIFVGVCTKDATTVRDSRGLAEMLGRLRWPHKSESRPVGHGIDDAALDHAVSFLRGGAAKAAPKPSK